jgi:hypothetical protein
MKAKGWDRLKWGVVFWTVGDGGRHRKLLGTGCNCPPPSPHYAGEPTRPLLFDRKKDAVAWCRAKRAQYRTRTDHLRRWRFTPVRVREQIAVMA